MPSTPPGRAQAHRQGLRRLLGESPDGRHFLYMKDNQIWLYTLDTESKNISGETWRHLADEEDFHPKARVRCRVDKGRKPASNHKTPALP
jgi:hypothetical protein